MHFKKNFYKRFINVNERHIEKLCRRTAQIAENVSRLSCGENRGRHSKLSVKMAQYVINRKKMELFPE